MATLPPAAEALGVWLRERLQEVEARRREHEALTTPNVGTVLALRLRDERGGQPMSPSKPARFALPEGGAARLYSFDHLAGFPWCVIAAGAPERAKPEALTARGSLAAVLTHDEGVTWPNARGEALAAATIDAGGAVAFAFASMGDALACKRRLEGGAA